MLENFRAQKIIWDRANKKIFEAIEANAGDSNGRKLVVQVINQETTEVLSGTTLSLGWKSRNGAKGLDAFDVVDASKGIFEIYYTTEMLSNIGNIEASLILIDSTGRIESSTFTISVRPSTVDDESIESENSFTALTEALVKVNEIDAQLTQKVGGGVKANLEDLSPTVLGAIQGGEGTSFNLLSVPQNYSVSNEKLTNDALLNMNIPEGADLNGVTRAGYHTGLGSGNYGNVPVGFDVRQMFSLEVIPISKYSNRFYLQVLIDRFEPHKRWIRRLDVVSKDFGSWKSLYQDFSNVDLSVRNLVANGTDLDTIKLSGTYLVVGGGSNNYPNAPSAIAGRSFMLKVEVYQQAGNFRLQYATPTDAPNEIYVRYNQDSSGGFIKTDWVRIGTSGSGGTSPLAGKIIYNFGDSVFGNAQSADSVSGALASITGATTYNVGFGGCQMSQHANHWDAFSMYRLADAITTGDYSLQDTAIQAGVSGMPSYFNTHLTRLKNADWSKVDFITIGYGTNDYTAGDLLDNPNDKFDTTTHGGALRYAIETILTAYPHIKILIVTSTYRFWFNADNLTFKEDSDEVSYNTNQDTLDKFAENAIKIAKEYKLPVKNLYHDLGINKFNRMHYFDAPDGVHHNAKGRRRIAESIVGALTNY